MKKFAIYIGIIGLLVAFVCGVCFALYRVSFGVAGMIAGMAMTGISFLVLDKVERKEQDPALEKFCQLYGG